MISAALLGQACNDRDRSNPLDPVQLAADGNPWRFAALAGDERVQLRWVDLGFDDLTRAIIERRPAAAPESTTATVELPLVTAGWVDSLLVNDRTYHYHFRPRLDDGREVAPVGPLVATPGPEVCWVANTGSLDSPIRLLTPDGRGTLLTLGSFRAPNDLDLVQEEGRLWIADTGNRRVVALDVHGEQLALVTGFVSPKAVAAARDGSVWVADEGSFQLDGALLHLGPTGEELLRLGGFSRPADLSVCAGDGSVWLSDTGTSTLWRFSAGGDTLLRLTDPERYVEPLQLDAAADGSVWLTDDELEIVAHVASDGSELLRLELAPDRPFGILLDEDTGHIWITLFAGGRLEQWSADGRLLQAVDGFTQPLGLVRNPRDGTVWVADVDGVTKLDAAGIRLGRQAGLARPFALALDLGGQRAAAGR